MARHAAALLALAAGTALAASTASAGELDACAFDASYPRQYVGYKLEPGQSIVVDGRIDDAAWREVGFTEEFVDIMGSPPMPVPRFNTQAKIRWDDEWLYFAGFVSEPQIWANNTVHDCVIYSDNDFEIFVNADGTTHYYKEFEMNAANYTWDLCLDKPYLNGGYENSSRVFPKHGFDMLSTKHAVFIDGELNDPAAADKYWTVEVAFKLSELALNETVDVPPRPGQYWRINFSRVEWHVKAVGDHFIKTNSTCDNWVWSPMGIVDVHLPERWGYLQFADGAVNDTDAVRDPTFTVRHVAMEVYYAEVDFQKNSGSYSSDLDDLKPLVPPHILDGVCTSLPTFTYANKTAFHLEVKSLDGRYVASVDDTRYLTVHDNFAAPKQLQ